MAQGGSRIEVSDFAHLKAGLAMPDLALASTRGGNVNLALQRGRAVVFVYPWTGRPGLPNPPAWDDIPGAHGSTPQAKRFRDLHPRFEAEGIEIVGLSGQDSDYQREFAERTQLPFGLLSDADGVFRDALGLPTFETGGVRYLKRLTFLVRDGRARKVFYPVPDPERHADDVLAHVMARLAE